VLGSAASWTTALPPVLDLPAGGEGSVDLHLHPPRAAHVRTGPTPFGVLASGERTRTSSVSEELILVGRFRHLEAELWPGSREGRSATYELTLRNRGNATEHRTVDARDLDGHLGLRCSPPALAVFPGGEDSARIVVRALRRRWSGGPEERTFQVVLRGEGVDPVILTGTLVEVPLLPWRP
jgi:hypothetical protein